MPRPKHTNPMQGRHGGYFIEQILLGGYFMHPKREKMQKDSGRFRQLRHMLFRLQTVSNIRVPAMPLHRMQRRQLHRSQQHLHMHIMQPWVLPAYRFGRMFPLLDSQLRIVSQQCLYNMCHQLLPVRWIMCQCRNRKLSLLINVSSVCYLC